MYSDYFHISPGKSAEGSFGGFRAPDVTFREQYDEELVREICRIADERQFPAGTLGERETSLDHGTMVPLWFIEKAYGKQSTGQNFRLVRVGLSPPAHGTSIPA